MLKRLTAGPNAQKYFAWVALLLMPGSFVVLPVWWLARALKQQVARFAGRSPASAARA